MTPRRSHDELQLLLPLLALDQIEDADERFALAEHLAECEACQLELAQIESTLESIQAAAPIAEPPAGLRARILSHPDVMARAGANTDAVQPTASAGDAAVARDAAPVSPAVEPADGDATATVALLSTRRARRRFVPARSAMLPVLAAACLLLAVVTVGLGVKINDLQGQRSDLRAAAADAKTEVASLRAPVIATNEAPVSLTGPLSEAKSAVALLHGNRTAIIVVRDMPPPGAGHSWQAWVLDAHKRPISLAVMDTGAPMAVLRVRLPKGATAIAFTLEPSGGSSKPTTSPVGYGSLI